MSGRHVRASWSLPAFAIFVTFAFLAVSLAPPPSGSATYAVAPQRSGETQTFQAGDEYTTGVVRDGFEITQIPTAPVAPGVGVPDPDTAQGVAWTMVQARGWDLSEFSCLVALWNRESHWNVYAHNASSGAYGIPQALPGEKMASAGEDWATNPATQITWGLGYIQARYETPCGAWAHSEENNWY